MCCGCQYEYHITPLRCESGLTVINDIVFHVWGLGTEILCQNDYSVKFLILKSKHSHAKLA